MVVKQEPLVLQVLVLDLDTVLAQVVDGLLTETMETTAPEVEKDGLMGSLEVYSPTSTVTGQEVMVDLAVVAAVAGRLVQVVDTTVAKAPTLVETKLQEALEVVHTTLGLTKATLQISTVIMAMCGLRGFNL